MNPGSENLYWLFSASAQSIAAFAALLITGFAIVNALMNNIEEKDESLIEIHEEIKSSYYTKMKWLAVLTTLAIILSLLAVFLNPYSFQYKVHFLIATASLNVISLVFGLAIVLTYLNPEKYTKAAERLREEEEKEIEASGEEVNKQEFFKEFVKLEKQIRLFLRKVRSKEELSPDPEMSRSMRSMLNKLLEEGHIGKSMYHELWEMNKYRNLVFHGNKDEIDKEMVKKVRDLARRTENLLNFKA